MAQLMPLLLTVSCFSKIQVGFTFLVRAYPGSPGQRAVKWVCVCVCVLCCVESNSIVRNNDCIVLQLCSRVRVTCRALEVCMELNLSSGVDYYESLIQLSMFESDRAKYVGLTASEFCDYCYDMT